MTRMERERRRRGWSQTQLAAYAGIHQSQVSDIERRKVEPNDAQRQIIARVLGLDAATVVEDVELEVAT